MRFSVEGVDHVALAVSDHEASQRWCRELLGLERAFVEEWGDSPAVLMARDSGIALFKAPHGETGPLVRHVAFRVDRANLEALRRGSVEAELPSDLRTMVPRTRSTFTIQAACCWN
jgi:catechol 2,3-dioxygenase-like lactoylglutathione lyase family enzyme